MNDSTEPGIKIDDEVQLWRECWMSWVHHGVAGHSAPAPCIVKFWPGHLRIEFVQEGHLFVYLGPLLGDGRFNLSCLRDSGTAAMQFTEHALGLVGTRTLGGRSGEWHVLLGAGQQQTTTLAAAGNLNAV